MPQKIILSQDITNNIVNKYIGGMSSANVAKEFGYSKPFILNVLNTNNIQKRKKSDYETRKYAIDDFAFDNLSEKSYYWLGMLCSDGCVEKDRNRVILQLNYLDYEHVIKYQQFLKTDNKVFMKSRKEECRTKPFAELRFHSKHIVQTLKSYGITSRKSLTVDPTVDLTVSKHFWRGMIDGDGCLSVDRSRGHFYPIIQLCGSEHVLDSYIKFIKNNVYNKFDPTLYHKYNNEFTSASVEGKVAFDIIKYLYKDSLVYLNRKYDLFLYYGEVYCGD